MYRIGIDLGGTNIAVGLVDKDLKIKANVSLCCYQTQASATSLPHWLKDKRQALKT